MITSSILEANGFVRRPEWDYGSQKKKQVRRIYTNGKVMAYIVGNHCTLGLLADPNIRHCTKYACIDDFYKFILTNHKMENLNEIAKGLLDKVDMKGLLEDMNKKYASLPKDHQKLFASLMQEVNSPVNSTNTLDLIEKARKIEAEAKAREDAYKNNTKKS